MMYDPYSGLINNLLVLVGLESWQHAWLGEADYAMWSIIFAGFPWITAFPFLVYMGGLINIDKDIFDAADIDGVSGMQRFFRIDLPLIRPQIRIILFFAYLGAIQMYSSIWVYTRGGPGHATYVPALQMYYQISNGANLGYASAIGLVLFFIVLVGTLSRFRFGKTATD
jgi:raffinose/stachyose/melibiose transport system permease protein